MARPPVPQSPLTWRDLTWLLVLLAVSFAGLLALGATRPFWFDEVFTLGAAGQFPAIDWGALRADVHPPGHVIAVSITAALVDSHGPWVRLINLTGLAALWAGIWLVARALDWPRALVFCALVLLSGISLSMALEMRAYALMLGLSMLGHGLLLHDLLGPRRRWLWAMGATALLLGSLHFYGTLLGHALLLCAGAARLWNRQKLAELWDIVVILALLTGVFALWAGWFLAGDAFGPRVSWIALEAQRSGILYPLVVVIQFLSQAAPVVVAGFAVWVLRRQQEMGPVTATTLWILLPTGIVLCVSVAVGLLTPIVTVKNLIVCLPGLALGAVLWAGRDGLGALLRMRLAVPVLALVALPGFWNAVTPKQDIPWALRQAAQASCDQVPLYTLDGGVVHRLGLSLYGLADRELKDLRSLTPDAVTQALAAGCETVGVLFHVTNTLGELEAFLSQNALDLEVVIAPAWQDTMGPSTLASHGVVLRSPVVRPSAISDRDG